MQCSTDRAESRQQFEWIAGLLAFMRDGSLDRKEKTYYFEVAMRMRNAFEAVGAELALDVAESGSWKGPQFTRPTQYMSYVGGMSASDAHRRLVTAKRLRDLPALRDDFAAGHLSFEQVALAAEAAEACPDSYPTVLDHARRDTFESLRKVCNRAKAAASKPKDHEEAARKVHLRQPGGDQFGKGLSGYLLNEQSAVLNAVLNPITDRIFRERWKDGTFISREHCRALALIEMAKLAASGSGSGPRHHVNLVVSLEALPEEQAKWSQLSEISGIGPVPLKTIKDELNDAYIKLVVVGAPSEVSEKYRPSAELQRRLDVDGDTCTLLGCDDYVDLDLDHNKERRDGGKTSYGNVDKICGPHHAYKTKYRMKLVGRRGRKKMVSLSPEEMYGGDRAGPPNLN